MNETEYTAINDIVCKFLSGDLRSEMLDFIGYLRDSEMAFERGRGYWENQYYWLIKFKTGYVCFILINGNGAEEKFKPLTTWSDDSESGWYENLHLNEHMEEVLHNNVDICENCGSCGGGKRRIIFGKEYGNVCRTAFRFTNPDAEAFECLKEIVTLRKTDILIAGM